MELRFAGMIVGVLVSFASAWVPFEAVGVPGLLGPLGVGLAGAPVGAILGWWLSPGIARSAWRRAIGIGIGAGLLAAPLGLLEYLYIGAVAGAASGPVSLFETGGGLIFVAMLGLVYCWFVLPVTIPSGIAAAVIVRGVFSRIASDPDPPPVTGFRHAAVVVGLVVIGSALVPLGGATLR